MELRTKIIEDSLLVKIIGELDHHTSGEIRQEVDHLFTKNNVKNIIFGSVSDEFYGQLGVGMFMGRYKNQRKKWDGDHGQYSTCQQKAFTNVGFALDL